MKHTSQGRLNSKITALADKPDELKKLMVNATDEQKEQGRAHLKTVRLLRGNK